MLILTTAKCATPASTVMERMATVAYATCQPIASGCRTDTNLRMRGIMTNTSTSKEIKIHEPLWGMWVMGYITETITDEGTVRYGTFPTVEEALDWAAKLDNAEVVAVYYPAYNRG